MTLSLILLGVGLALILAEVLVPSLGILSVLATMAIAAAVFLAFRQGFETGAWFSGITLLVVPVMVVLAFRIFPHSPLGRRLVASGLSFESRRATDVRDLELSGAEGVVEVDCRPTGVARVHGRRVDVVSRGELIEAGTRIRVIEISGNRVVVASEPSHSMEEV